MAIAGPPEKKGGYGNDSEGSLFHLFPISEGKRNETKQTATKTSAHWQGKRASPHPKRRIRRRWEIKKLAVRTPSFFLHPHGPKKKRSRHFHFLTCPSSVAATRPSLPFSRLRQSGLNARASSAAAANSVTYERDSLLVDECEGLGLESGSALLLVSEDVKWPEEGSRDRVGLRLSLFIFAEITGGFNRRSGKA